MPHPDPAVESLVLEATRATAVRATHEVQSLWSGYGQVLRLHLDGAAVPSVIVKRVRWPSEVHHPRGWSTSRSHERKVRSYAVEAEFYRAFAPACDEGCRVARLLAETVEGDGVVLVFEDLDAAGFPARCTSVSEAQLHAGLRWLAAFHATFLGCAPDGLWATGTYWHLATRPDELAAMGDTPLARAASSIDEQLRACPYQTLVHGDAKLANLCFTPGPRDVAVAAVDFQYVGGGCGIQDVAYFIGSCLDERELEGREASVLDVYFDALTRALDERKVDVDVAKVVAAWRALYPVAWTDFYRFLSGWSPGHWKIHDYTRRLADQVLDPL